MSKEAMRTTREIATLITESLVKRITGDPGDHKTPIDLTNYIKNSKALLGSYVTLDPNHIIDILRIREQIKLYIDDKTRTRPLNIMLIAPPGIGKSHFVKSLAESISRDKVSTVTYNMASLVSASDLINPLDMLRNLKVDDIFPILFLDEVDSNHDNYSFLLPLLWDAKLQFGHQNLSVGKLVIFLAVSTESERDRMMISRQVSISTKATKEQDKLPDLLSRINGGIIVIPDLEYREDGSDRRADKIVIAISLLQRRFKETLQFVPYGLLRFIALAKFTYGVRSIENLLDLIPLNLFDKPKGMLLIDTKILPLSDEQSIVNSGLSSHFQYTNVLELIELYNSCISIPNLIKINNPPEKIAKLLEL